jgi:membrane-associated progesterone receptor component
MGLFSEQQQTYLNYGIIILIVYVLAKRFLSRGEVAEEPEILEPMSFTTFTPNTLSKYNGEADPRVLLAVKAKVYDVTAGKNFYGPGGPYANFAGRDASRGLACNSFDPEMLTDLNDPIDTLNDLTPGQVQALNDWLSLFEAKYPVVGELVNEDKFK